MANIRFGSIVTGIKGSIGGTTYREMKNGFVAQTRSSGGNKTKLRENNKLAQLNEVIQLWQNLTPEWREEWAAETLNWTFPDKWGNLRNLTPREFYIKFANQARNIGVPISAPWNINDIINYASLSTIQITLGGTAKMFWASQTGEVYISMWANLLHKGAWEGNSKKSAALAFGRVDLTLVTDFTAKLWERYPYAEVDQPISVYWNFYNKSGWKSQLYSNWTKIL